jgi:tRNA (guanine-N7-)-methyltransferase
LRRLSFFHVIELIPKTYLVTLDLIAIFGRSAPLQVDLGCGDGLFLCDLAGRHPEKNFLGVERLAGRVTKSCRNAANFSNVRILRAETSYSIRYLLPEQSVETFYLFFPDPWPKRRHHRRRIVTMDFLDSSHAALQENGCLYIATDHMGYFQQIQRLVQDHRFFVNVGIADLDLPPTKFERRLRAQGASIHRLALRKVSPVM